MSSATAELLGEPLLTAQEVADFLHVHKATVYRLAGQPCGIPVVEMKGSVRFRPSDVRAYVERNLISNQGGSRADRLITAAQVAERPAVLRTRTRTALTKTAR